jgi:hypothetical protein
MRNNPFSIDTTKLRELLIPLRGGEEEETITPILPAMRRVGYRVFFLKVFLRILQVAYFTIEIDISDKNIRTLSIS